jgi:crotonobetaine/carnitine-CoA ligase
VIGVASELSEDDVKAFVVTSGPADFAALRTWAAERLAAFKVPRYWQQLPALPRTPTQRVAKHQLPSGHPAEEFDAEQGVGS